MMVITIRRVISILHLVINLLVIKLLLEHQWVFMWYVTYMVRKSLLHMPQMALFLLLPNAVLIYTVSVETQ